MDKRKKKFQLERFGTLSKIQDDRVYHVSSVTFHRGQGEAPYTINFHEKCRRTIIAILVAKKRGKWKRYDRFIILEIAREMWASSKVTVQQAIEQVEHYLSIPLDNEYNNMMMNHFPFSFDEQDDVCEDNYCRCIYLGKYKYLANIHFDKGECRLDFSTFDGEMSWSPSIFFNH